MKSVDFKSSIASYIEETNFKQEVEKVCTSFQFLFLLGPETDAFHLFLPLYFQILHEKSIVTSTYKYNA